MGKKSRKGKGGKTKPESKTARKERLQERRERVDADDAENNNDDRHLDLARAEPRRTYFVEDRVWFVSDESDGSNPNTYRGYVRGVREDSLDIIPIQSMIDGHDVTWNVSTDDVFPDFEDMTLRFDVGDPVVCNTAEGWIPLMVDYQWPIYEMREWPQTANDRVPAYKCGDVAAPRDHDYFIMKHPTFFRFDVGEGVVFNPKFATANGRTAKDLAAVDSWCNGTVTDIDITGREDGYFVYECSFDFKGKTRNCLIPKDTDEYIAQRDASPRGRLLEAIKHDCTPQHLTYLTSFYSIDISTFRDLVINTATWRFASYNAILWLQEDHGIDVFEIRDNSGNNFLHKIAQSEYAARFIRDLDERKLDNGPKLGVVYSRTGRMPMIDEFNNEGETWLHILVKRGDVKAFDAVLSLQSAFLWDYMTRPFLFDDDKIANLENYTQRVGNHRMQLIFDTFKYFCTKKRQYDCLHERMSTTDQPEDGLLAKDEMALFRDENAEHYATQFVQFVYDWQSTQHMENHNVFFNIVKNGFFSLFQLFYQADKKWFWNEHHIVHNSEDDNEYIQPEISNCRDESPEMPFVNLLTICMLGGSEYKRYIKELTSKQQYLCGIKNYFLNCRRLQTQRPSLLDHLRNELKFAEYDDSYSSLLKYKIACLEDNQSLDGRLKILSIVMQDAQTVQLDVLVAIRFRQCGVLRWMVNNKLVDFNEDATKIKDLNKRSTQFYFTSHGKRIPSMSFGDFLCFAAVELDDLYSLQWISESHCYPNKTSRGLNLLHLASLMGRVEIIGWLQTTPIWNALVDESCGCKPYEGAFAAHISAGQGHIDAADILLEFGCKEYDSNGRLPEFYAKQAPHLKSLSTGQSDYAYARGWANKREQQKESPKSLENNINKLLQILATGKSTELLKDHILASKCLDIEPWLETDCENFETPGPMGLSFGDVVDKCLQSHDVAFSEWICIRLLIWPDDWQFEYFWKQPRGTHFDSVGQYDPLSFTNDNDNQKLINTLSHRYANKLTIADPDELVILSLPSLGSSDLSLRLKSKFIRIRTWMAVGQSIVRHEIQSIISSGGLCDEIMELIEIYGKARRELEEEGCFSPDLLEHSWRLKSIFRMESPIDMNTHLNAMKYDTHPLQNRMLCSGEANYKVSAVCIVIATEGYTALVDFCLGHLKGWTAKMELDMVRIASYLGHTSIVDIFLRASDYEFYSDIDARYHSAMLGVAEAGGYNDLLHLTLERDGFPSDPLKEHVRSVSGENETESELAQSLLKESLIVAAICGYITGTFMELLPISMIVNKFKYSHGDILYAMELALIDHKYFPDEAECVLRFIGLMKLVIDEFDMEPMQHQRQIRVFSKQVVEFVVQRRKSCTYELPEQIFPKIVDWLGDLIAWVDIQDLDLPRYFTKDLEEFNENITVLKDTQMKYWSQFDIVKNGDPLTAIQHSIECGDLVINGRDRGGLMLTHLAAAYDRVDLLEWLVLVKGMDLDSIDGAGRTSQQVAEAARARSTCKWISEFKARKIILDFINRHHLRMRAVRKHRKMARNTIAIQKVMRGFSTRRIYRGALLLHLEEFQRFHAIWSQSIQSLPDQVPVLTGWTFIKTRTSDISRAEINNLHDYGETNVKLGQALAIAVQESCNKIDFGEEVGIDAEKGCTAIVPDDVPSFYDKKWSDAFQVTSHIVKFLRQGDPRYRSFFVKRMQQLANGDRSRILQKRLKGSKSTIFETYLEQKSGFRILWTEEGETIVVWFVAKHKSVSRLMKLIDDAKSRSTRQKMTQSVIGHLQQNNLQTDQNRSEILLDIGNVPLKVYDLTFASLEEITKASWTPQMHLTEEEREVVEANGTVLLLGRSGTGKTICLINRMEFDRQKFGHDPTFSQLFVARSSRLCKYVKEAVGGGANTQQFFMTFQELTYQLESCLPQSKSKKQFAPSQRVDFRRFQRDFFHPKHSAKGKPSALIVWKTINTFLKGSIEAFQNPDKILPREYFVSGKLGKNRCRVSPADFATVYDIFLEYQKYICAQSLWDDSDRVSSLLLRLEKAKLEDPSTYERVKRNKIYVDEIQDYTQIECLLYFYLGGPGGLFLAGDSAQSVQEGSDFRFEEVRSVGYFVAGSERRDLIPQKPKIVNVNFRSHAGILNTAAAILDYLFTYFPQSAKQLQKDHGLFQGPRPGVCHRVSHKQLAALLKGKLNGVVVLTHDESACGWRRTLEYPLVYGIREAKGLEFRSVIILGFFAELPTALQRPWRNLVLNRGDLGFEAYPVLETILKLLYTAVTRSIEQLYFVETSSSIAGDASVRWLTTTTIRKKGGQQSGDALATLSNVGSLESLSMTCDEWVSAGVDNAEMAEGDDIELEKVLTLLDRSVYCFEQAQEVELAAKARTHRQSVQFRFSLVGINESSTNELATAESKAAQLLESLLVENLLKEALYLIESFIPFLPPYTREELEKYLVSKLQLAAS